MVMYRICLLTVVPLFASRKEGDMNWPTAFYITLVSGVGLFFAISLLILLCTTHMSIFVPPHLSN